MMTKHLNLDGEVPTLEPALLDVSALAIYLAINERHVRRLVSERRVPYLKIGHLVRFDRAAIDVWLLGRRVPERDGLQRRRNDRTLRTMNVRPGSEFHPLRRTARRTPGDG